MLRDDDARPLPKAMLVDLDDTIITFDAVADQAWMEVCRAGLSSHGPEAVKTLFDAITQVREWYWSDPARSRVARMNANSARREIVAMAMRQLGLGDEATAVRIADHYSVRRIELIGLIPMAKETLVRLQQAGVMMALVTNGDAAGQRRKIEQFGLAQFFLAIFIEGEQGVGKPEPEIYRRAMKTLGVPPSQAWSVGDNLESDVGGPQKLGVYGIWNDFRKQGLPAQAGVKPDRIVHSIAELLPS